LQLLQTNSPKHGVLKKRTSREHFLMGRKQFLRKEELFFRHMCIYLEQTYNQPQKGA
jgi:hypothetical protein